MSAAAQPLIVTDGELVRQAASGSAAAFEALVLRHFDTVHAIAYARLGQREAAEDLAQEIFLRAWLHLATLRDGSRFGAWVAQMTRNHAINWVRGRQRSSRVVQLVPLAPEFAEQVADAQPNVRQRREAAEQDAALHRAMESLPPSDRELVTLHYLAGQTQREIADRLGTHHTTVCRRLEKAVGQLRDLMGAEPARRPLATGRAKSVACGLAATMVVAPEALRSALRQVAGPEPTWLGAQLGKLAGLSDLVAPIGAGVKAMTIGKKIAVAVVAVALLGGGMIVLKPDPSVAAPAGSPAAPPAPSLPPIAVGTNFDQVIDIPFGKTATLDFEKIPNPTPELDKYLDDFGILKLTANADKTLTVEATQTDGTQVSHTLAMSTPQDPIEESTTVQVWQETNRVLLQSWHVRATPTGIQVAFFRKNRPDLLPEIKKLEADFAAGRISKGDVERQVDAVLQKNGLYPSDPANRDRMRQAVLKVY